MFVFSLFFYFAQKIMKTLVSLAAGFTNLIELRAEGCGITNVCGCFEKLEHLEKLDLSCNELSNVPHSFGFLTNLRVVLLSYNNFTAVPTSLVPEESERETQIDSFEYLSVIGNFIQKETETIGKLKIDNIPFNKFSEGTTTSLILKAEGGMGPLFLGYK